MSSERLPVLDPRGSRERSGLLLLALALLFNAVFLIPELRIGQMPLNDLVFHLAASERLGESFSRGEPLLDPWVSEWSLGYPVWRSYQPLPHLVATAWLRITEPFASHAAAFAVLQYLLLVLLPASVYGGARLLGLGPVAAGLAALLVLAPSATGELDRYGLSYGAQVWRGSGLYTQLVALHFLVWALGFGTRALDTGKPRALAALAIAATALSHIVFGYVAFVSAALLAIFGPAGERGRRLARFFTIVIPALFLLMWFVLPLFLDRHEVNHSRWEDPWKWDSLGARFILSELFAGHLFDGGRLPVLSLFVATGALIGGLSIREPLPQRLLGLSGLWLAVFFGRETWGHLLFLLGVPADFHLHRLQAAFELSAVLLAAWGLERLLHGARGARRWIGATAAATITLAFVPIACDRAAYLATNRLWGEENRAAYLQERSDLDAALEDLRQILAERPGRVSAGKAASWGNEFKIGSVPVYAFLTREHFDQVSFLYHSMSLTSDVMVVRDENDRSHDVAFGVRAVVAPAGRRMPQHLHLRSVHGRFAVYEDSPEGYFGLVDVGARYTGPAWTRYEPSAAWLQSDLVNAGIVAALGEGPRNIPGFGRWEALPPPSPSLRAPRGEILSEARQGETYRARVSLVRPCHVLLKITFDPHLVATVDGRPAPTLRVTPGFAAVPVAAGEHEVAVRYEPGPLRGLLLLAGLFAFGGGVVLRRTPGFIALEGRASRRLREIGAAWSTPPGRAAAALAVLIIVALHPLFRGQLVDGHDALEYPPRLVEMTRALADGQIPPVWAPDLGGGHGQPLFEFVPPLLYLAASPIWALGAGLADALQVGLGFLAALGAIAAYRLGRRMRASRPAALAGAAAWLFAPYVALDLFVRGAFGEASAAAVAPLALLGLLRAMDRPSAYRSAAAALAVALVPLGHNGAALLLIPAFALVVLVRTIGEDRPVATAAGGALALAGGLGLSAFFWLPAVFEKSFVKSDLLREGFLHWHEHAISPLQLLSGKWGYGFSVPGPADGMSFALGPLHLVLGATGLLIALHSRQSAQRSEAIAFATIATAGAWLATDWSAPLWSRIGTLQYLAYPWRALLLPALFLPLLATAAFDRMGPRIRALLLGLLVAVNLPHTEPKGYLTFDDEYYAPASIAEKGINTTTREEYEPRWVEARPPYSAQRLIGRESMIEARAISARTAREELLVRASGPTRVESSTFYYPGWIVLVDGRVVRVDPSPRSGTIEFELPAGEHRVVLELHQTPARRLGLGITLVTAAVLVLGQATIALIATHGRGGGLRAAGSS